MRRLGPLYRRTVHGADRHVEPEWLDELPAEDPRAVRSRRDLRRINGWMGNVGLLEASLKSMISQSPRTIAEIGSGDGTFMLKLAERLSKIWKGVTVHLVDRQHLLAGETTRNFEALGWKVWPVEEDVFPWLSRTQQVDVIVANLFLHHFENRRLATLLEQASFKAIAFAACEPRRFSFPWLAGQLVSLIGCNGVTRHDAVASVRAGFIGQELSRLWPSASGWRLHESEAGLFSHCFCASRLGAA